jgi:hypothetical protein
VLPLGENRISAWLVKAWDPVRIAAAAAVLRQDYPQVSTFEIVRIVWSVARVEPPAPQALRLLHRARHFAREAAAEGRWAGEE